MTIILSVPSAEALLVFLLQYWVVTSVYRCDAAPLFKVNNSACEAAHQNANDLEAQWCGHVGSGLSMPGSLNEAHDTEIYLCRLGVLMARGVSLL